MFDTFPCLHPCTRKCWPLPPSGAQAVRRPQPGWETMKAIHASPIHVWLARDTTFIFRVSVECVWQMHIPKRLAHLQDKWMLGTYARLSKLPASGSGRRQFGTAPFASRVCLRFVSQGIALAYCMLGIWTRCPKYPSQKSSKHNDMFS